MLTQKSLFFFLSTTLLVTLTSESSSAFSITQNPGFLDYQAYSVFIGKGQGFTTLNAADPLDPSSSIKALPFVTPITLGGTAGLLADLQLYRDEGWTFKQGRDLQGRFDVERQYACGNLSLCGLGMREIPGRSTVGVTGIGSLLEFNYIPRTDLIIPDPQPSTANLYWIQRVVTNYPAYDSQGKPGTRTSYIDNLDGRGQPALYPYFATGRKVDATGYFGDRPYRPFEIDPNDGSGNLFRDYYWYAEQVRPTHPRLKIYSLDKQRYPLKSMQSQHTLKHI